MSPRKLSLEYQKGAGEKMEMQQSCYGDLGLRRGMKAKMAYRRELHVLRFTMGPWPVPRRSTSLMRAVAMRLD